VTIPLLDIHAQHASIQEELDEAIAQVLRHGRFVGGPEIANFEEAFASYCLADHCIGCSSGTSAVTLALRAVGVGPGDEVITTTFTFIATVESIMEAGATPVLVDVDPETALARVEDVESAITSRTKAIVVVHLYGQPVDMTSFAELAAARRLRLVEDAAQAHGAEWRGGRIGSLGDAAAFSFFPGKNLGALGDAGAVTTTDSGVAARVRSLRNHGRSDKYRHDEIGTNARIDTLQAAILATKLRHLEDWTEARREHAAAYDAALGDIDGVSPIVVHPSARAVYHQYVVRVSNRELALDTLKEQGVSAGVHYPIPLHRQPALAGGNHRALPHADRLAGEVLSLPVYPELSVAQRDTVIEAVSQYAMAAAETSMTASRS
jgi:dTDP-4-amino-4,6-dideoxygalactose transaminase